MPKRSSKRNYSTIYVNRDGLLMNGPDRRMTSIVMGLGVSEEGDIVTMNKHAIPCQYELTISNIRKLLRKETKI